MNTLPHNVKAICHPEYLVMEAWRNDLKKEKQQCFALASLLLSSYWWSLVKKKTQEKQLTTLAAEAGV